ncbi:MAG: MBL fold metallo-hydrolase [Angustibacter sp.]
MRLTVVGCSGSVPGPGSAASCYLLEVDEPLPAHGAAGDGSDDRRRTWRVLLDLGSGALGPLQRYVDPRTLDAVLLSHLHPDHWLDLCGLYVLRRHAPGADATPRARMVVWGPADTARRLARAYDLDEQVGMSDEYDVRAWSDAVPVSVGPVTVTPYRVAHPGESYGVRVEHGGAVLSYTGDTDSCEALNPLCAGASVVLADSAFVEGRDDATGVHLSARRAASATRAAGGVGRLVLTHLPPWNDPVVALADARALWDGPLDLARPGLVLEVGQSSDRGGRPGAGRERGGSRFEGTSSD